MKVLMCKPTFFDIEYEINPWMNVNIKANTSNAMQQWQRLYQTLKNIGVNVELIDAVEHLPDMVFTANAGLVHENKVFPARFRYDERQGEEPYFEKWFADKGYQVVEPSSETSAFSFEGEGDALFAGNKLFAGHGIRSDKEFYPNIKIDALQSVVYCELVDNYFYHLDTCFCPLTSKLALWWPQAFTQASQRAMHEHIDLIAVPEDEAKRFACNAVVVGENIVMPAGCPETAKKLEDLGFRVHFCEMDEFIKAGGACKCLVLILSN